MLEKIIDELTNAGKRISADKIFEAAPLYLIRENRENAGGISYFTEKLPEELEKTGIFPPHTGGVAELEAEYGCTDIGARSVPGLADSSGNFRETLEQWLSFLDLHHQILHGIVFIRIGRAEGIAREDMWWSRFFRQLGRYKQRFLFFFIFGEDSPAEIRENLTRHYFCRTISAEPPGRDELIGRFRKKLEHFSLKADEGAEEKLVSLLEKHGADPRAAELWESGIIWDHLSLGGSQDTLTVSDISEDDLLSCAESCSKKSSANGIGFMST